LDISGYNVHAILVNLNKNRAPMIRDSNPNQLSITDFDWPFLAPLDANNRWVKLGECIPWDELTTVYSQGLDATQGRPTKDARLVIGAVIIKHKLCLSDRETVAQIQENPYLQYFVGLPGYQLEEPFHASLFVEIRKRMGASVFEAFESSIIASVDEAKTRTKPLKGQSKNHADQDNDAPPPPTTGNGSSDDPVPHQGKLILDATVAPQAIRYPTDLSLLNEAREFTEQIIDQLYAKTELKKKPRTYRRKARQAYLAIAKQKRPLAKVRRKGIKQQLQYLRRNLGHIEALLEHFPQGQRLPLPKWLLYRYWVIPHLYAQQQEMYQNKTHRCDDRIVSISQPYVRPIVRGKQDKPVEFGAKLSVSLNEDGIACVDHLRWDAFHEGLDLPGQVEAYRERKGYYPEVVLGDPIYGTRDNRNYLKKRGIRFAGKPLGRPRKVTEENAVELKKAKEQRREEYRQRIPIEGKFGQGKNGYRLNYIRAKRADTSLAWINSIFLVMNLMVLLKLFFALNMRAWAALVVRLKRMPVIEKRLWLTGYCPEGQMTKPAVT
jgi:hypothetical protein